MALRAALNRAHFLDQWNEIAFRKIECAFFEFFRSGWKALMPGKFGVLFRIKETDADGESTFASIFTLWNKGKLELYQRPNFSGLAPEKKDKLHHLARHLNDRYSAPIQVLEVERPFWNGLCRDERLPWKALKKEIEEKRARLWPDKGGLKGFVWAQALLSRK